MINVPFSLLRILSIHAPTRGATLTHLVLQPIMQSFNPRSYKRSDMDLHFSDRRILLSIHAPTRGATEYIGFTIWCECLSIHAPTRGATPTTRTRLWSSCFQSTLLQEERLFFYRSPSLHNIFQSTLLQEERQQKCTIFLMHLCNNYCIVSI